MFFITDHLRFTDTNTETFFFKQHYCGLTRAPGTQVDLQLDQLVNSLMASVNGTLGQNPGIQRFAELHMKKG